jgi:hypothetical protein
VLANTFLFQFWGGEEKMRFHRSNISVYVIFLVISIFFIACQSSGGGDSSNVGIDEGQSDFVSAGSIESGDAGGAIPGGAEFEAGEAVDDEDGDQNAQEVLREIEEADIVEIDGSTLYILNRYRGLIICDISQPDSPSISGRVSITGDPVEMYIRDNRAYIIVSTFIPPVYGGMEADVVGGGSSAVSRMDIVDVSNKAAPVVTGSFDIEGQVTDSRIVGDVLYVVSSEYEYYDILYPETRVTGGDTAVSVETGEAAASDVQAQSNSENTYVASIDVSNPNNIMLVDRVDFGGSTEFIHVSQAAIFVESSSYNEGSQETQITYVDISDPAGAISTRGSINIKGYIKDEFKMDYYDGYFRVCTHKWEGGGVSNLFVIDVSDPDNMSVAGSVQLGEGEQLFATRFDETRAYMVTFEQVDPLWVIDLSDPNNPEIKGELEVPGWSEYIVPKGDRLIALGIDNTGGWLVSVSLFDVSDPTSPDLVDRVSLGSGGGWSSSAAFEDIHALTILDDMGLILLPYSTSDYIEGEYSYDSRLQLIDYSENDLTVRGWVSQKGSVLRSRSFSDRLFSVSLDELLVINAANRDNPQVTASLTLALNVVDFMPLSNGYGVQVISESSGGYSLRAVPLSDPDTGAATGEIALDGSSYSAIFGNGGVVYVVSSIYDTYILEAEASVDSRSYYGSTKVTVYDFSSPSSPRARGSLDLPGNYNRPVTFGGGAAVYPYYGSGEIVQFRSDVLVFSATTGYYYPIYYDHVDGVEPGSEGDEETAPGAAESSAGAGESQVSDDFSGLFVVDLSAPDNPQLVAEFPIDFGNTSGYFAHGETIYFSYSSEIGDDEDGRPQAKYYLGRVDMSAPAAPAELPPINIPGLCLGFDESGSVAYTINNEWADYYSQNFTFNTSMIEDDTAVLLDRVELEYFYYYTVIADGFAYLSGYQYYWDDSSDFIIIDLSNPESLVKYENSLEGGGADIIGAKNRKVFVSISGGIACYDIANPADPELDDFVDNAGWSNRVVFYGGKAYLPLGYYGTWVKSL